MDSVLLRQNYEQRTAGQSKEHQKQIRRLSVWVTLQVFFQRVPHVSCRFAWEFVLRIFESPRTYPTFSCHTDSIFDRISLDYVLSDELWHYFRMSHIRNSTSEI